MNSDRWERVMDVFHNAATLEHEQREEFLGRECAGDEGLRSEVESLLAHHHRPLNFLEVSALGESFSIEQPLREESASDPMLNRHVGPYRVESKIGAGGMGTVYRGVRDDGQLDLTVAIKLMHPWHSSPELIDRFKLEWQVLARLSHPNIARILDAGLTEQGVPFLIMEHIEGRPLDEHCDDLGLSVPQRLELFGAVAHAVHFAHQNLVVHRDLKPANILVTQDGVPKLLDFGIAKLLHTEAGGGITSPTQTAMMTPHYASPEQIRGDAVTTATDVYSLGVILYELLSGRRPYFTATTSAQQIESVLADREPQRPSSALVSTTERSRGAAPTAEALARTRAVNAHKLRRLLRGDLDNIVMAALRKDPTRRYASAEELAQDLRRHRQGLPVIARADTIGYRAWKFVTRNRWASAAGLTAVLAAIGGVVATGSQARIAEAEAVHARIEADSARRIASVLTDMFLATPERTAAELEDIERMLARHVVGTRLQFASEPHQLANLLDALGRVYLDLGSFERAERLIGEAAEIRRNEFGDASLESALSLGSLGELAHRKGDSLQASQFFEQALELHQSLPRGVHTDVAKAANDLAVTLRQLGQLERAETLHEQALALRRQSVGEHHPAVAESLNNLSAISAERGDYENAKSCSERVLDIRRQTMGQQHPMVAQALNNLATCELYLGQTDEAIRHMGEAVALYRSIPGVDREGLARTLTNMGSLLRLSGQLTEAREAVAEALELHRKRLGTDHHPHVVATLRVLAQIEQDMGETAQALERLASLLQISRDLYPPGHTKIGAVLCSLGSSLIESGNNSKAERVYREALKLYLALENSPRSFVAAAEYGLGVSLLNSGRSAEAKPLLISARDRFAQFDAAGAESATEQLARLSAAADAAERTETSQPK